MFRIDKKLDFSDCTFIIPSISVGNVGQLTTDLLISTFNLTKIGFVWHKAIIPLYGANPFDNSSSENCSACELYGSKEDKCIVLQIRSSIEPRMINMFLNDLKLNIEQEQFKQVIILGSTFSYEMHDPISGFFRYVTNTNLKDILEKNKVLPLNCLDNRPIIHGSGFASKLYTLLAETINAAVILKYVSEGDNRNDAISMLHILTPCLGITKNYDIKFPSSWDLMFGSPAPTGIY